MPKHLIPSHMPSALLNGGGREPFARLLAGVDLAALASGVETLVAVPVYAGDVITTVSFLSGATGMTFGTDANQKWWFALRSADGTLLAQTAAQVGAWAAATMKSVALTAPQTIEADGFVFASCMADIGTGGSPVIATLRGATIGAAAVVQPAGTITVATLAGTTGTALTDTAPVGPLTPAPVVTAPWCLLT